MAAPKKYGLIITKKSDKKQTLQSKPSVFGNDSDEEDPRAEVNKTIQKAGKKAVLKRQTQLEIEKALEQDPTVYEYDSIYDDMQKAKFGTPESKKKDKQADRKPKYIESLLKAAEVRKRENERRTERQVQKEREQERGMYDDSESFVTGAYKKKLQEMQEEEEEERRKTEMEERMDVTKQRDLSGFYRHLLNQTTGEEKVPSNVQDAAESKKEQTSQASSTSKPRFSEDRDLTPSDSAASSDGSDSDSDTGSHRKSTSRHDGKSHHGDHHKRGKDRDDKRDSHGHRADDRDRLRNRDTHEVKHRRDREEDRPTDRHRDSKDKDRHTSRDDTHRSDRDSRRTEHERSDKRDHDKTKDRGRRGESSKRKQDSDAERRDSDSEKPVQGPQLPSEDAGSAATKITTAVKLSKHTAGESLMDAKARYLARKKNRQIALAPSDD